MYYLPVWALPFHKMCDVVAARVTLHIRKYINTSFASFPWWWHEGFMKAFMQTVCGTILHLKGKYTDGKNVHWGHKLAFLRPLSPSYVCASYFGCQFITPVASSLKSKLGEKKCRGNRNAKKGWTLTSETDTEAGGATSEWLWVAGSQSGDRPRPPATPRCQPMADDRALGHLLTFASVSQTLMREQRGEKVTTWPTWGFILWLIYMLPSGLHSFSLPKEAEM